MTDALIIKIQASKIHLILTLFVYAISAFAAWYYAPYFWLSLMISFALLVGLYDFLPNVVLLNWPNSINQITLYEDNIVIQKNDKSTERYPQFYPAYQSRFLVIIKAGKKYVVIFKDAIAPPSLSNLNRTLNAKR